MNEKKLKRLPLGMSTFSDLIQDDYIYVDKTRDIYQMITSGKYYFLSRPRRFGKSLLIATLEALFSGKKELFANLWIDKSDWTWQTHPVVRFDFSTISHLTSQELQLGIIDQINITARQHGIDLTNEQTLGGKFKTLIMQLAQKNKVIILIDEYDKPILDHIDNLQEAKAQREVLKSLYSGIKGADQYLRFVLLTGVSKFAQTSIFSGINNLTDISMDARYATMLGYTHKEIEIYLHAHLGRLAEKQKISYEEAIKQLTDYYDGYQFVENAERVFNPYSVLLCCDKEQYKNYWFASGTPTFLITVLQKNDYDLQDVTNPTLNESNLGSFEPDNIPLSSLLFQTGYLTIKAYDPKNSNYTLGIPNREVNAGLTTNLVDAFTQLPANKSIQYARKLIHAFANENMIELQEKLQEFFNRMPYTVHIKTEQQLQFVLYAIFALIGVAVDPEVTTSIGRADLVVSLPQLVYIIELKFNKSTQEALTQIQDKRYYEKYENTGKKITLLGINFKATEKIISLESQQI